jgi:hypothetical protein
MDQEKDAKLDWMKEELEVLMKKWKDKGGDPESKPDHMKAYFRHYKYWSKR